MRSADVLQEHFKEFPFVITNTKRLLQQCTIDFGFDTARKNQNLQVYCHSFDEDYKMLLQLCNDKLHKRYPIPTEKVHARLQKELKVIIE